MQRLGESGYIFFEELHQVKYSRGVISLTAKEVREWFAGIHNHYLKIK